jgi:DNA-binding transcriptional ArsR family regulator
VSIEALNWAWEQRCPNPTSKLVLMALADHANSDGECWPAMKRIAELSGISARQVSTHITHLEQLGYVTKGARRRHEGQLRGWEYRVNLRKRDTSGSVLPLTSGSVVQVPAEVGFRSEPPENHQKKPLPTATQPKQKDTIFEAVAEACGWELGSLTRSARGQLNRATKELRDIGATPEQIAGRAKGYRKQYPSMSLTPSALVKHWAALDDLSVRSRKSVWETYERQEWY